jgi:hypothetical protein
LRLSVVGGGVRMPAVQLTEFAPVSTPRPQAGAAGSATETQPVDTRTAVPRATPVAERPRTRAADFVPLQRKPKRERN